MRRLRYPSAFGAALACALPGALSCSNDKPTELVPGALSQVQVPRDLDGIELEVKANGVVKFCGTASVFDGKVELPRTFGVVAGGSAETIVTVTLRGFGNSTANANFGNCIDSAKVGTADGPQVMRRSIQTFVGQHTLFLPMSLSYSCFNTDCSSMGAATSGETTNCKASRCVDLSQSDPKEVASKLVDFTPSLVNGTDLCFSPSQCFIDEQPAIPVGTASGTGTVGAEPGAGAEEAGASEAEAGDGSSASNPTEEAAAGNSSASDCTYGFAMPPRGPGINVKVFYQDFAWTMNSTTQQYEKVLANAGEVEILDDDPEEGFSVSPTNSQQITLAPGLCDLVHAVDTPPPPPTTGVTQGPPWHTISNVRIGTICEPKKPLLPICAGERNPPSGDVRVPNLPDGGTTTDGLCNVAVPLEPTPSAIYMVMDDSAAMRAAFGAHGYATAMGLSLTDPIFKRTYASFKFLPHLNSECTSAATSLTTPDIDFELAASAQSQIASRLQNWAAPGDTPTSPKPLDLQAAMRSAGAYGNVLSFLQAKESPDIAAVMFFLNRVPLGEGDALTGPLANDCSPPLFGAASAKQAIETEALAAFHSSPSLQTFFVVLGSDAVGGVTDTTALDFYNAIQTDIPQAVTTLDATSADPQVVLGNFANVVTRLGTCLYEAPTAMSSSGTALTYGPGNAVVSYRVPGLPPAYAATTVAVDTTCTAATQNSSNGWNIDEAGRLRICGPSCDTLRQTILLADATALQAGLPSPDVAVTVTATCGAADAGLVSPPVGSSDAGHPGGSLDATVEGGSNAEAGSGALDASSADADATSMPDVSAPLDGSAD